MLPPLILPTVQIVKDYGRADGYASREFGSGNRCLELAESEPRDPAQERLLAAE